MQDHTEISIVDVVRFLLANLKLYVVTVAVCIGIGLSITWVRPQYTAASVVHYLGNDSNFSQKHFDLVTWRAQQHKLIRLAQELALTNKPGDAPSLSAALSSPAWWATHVTPIKSLTLDEAKELLGINSMIVGPNKPSDESDTLQFLGRAIKESTRISSIAIQVTAKSSEAALNEATSVAKFIQEGLGIIEYRSLIFSLTEKLRQSSLQVAIDLDQAQLDLLTIHKRRSGLLQLALEFPSEKLASAPLYVTDANIKYLPLTNQLIAVSIEMNELNEKIEALKRRELENKTLSAYVRKASEILVKSISAQGVGDQLVAASSALLAQPNATNLENKLAIHAINKELRQTQANLQSQIALGTSTLREQPDLLKSIFKSAALGLALGFILSILLLLVRLSLKQKPFGN